MAPQAELLSLPGAKGTIGLALVYGPCAWSHGPGYRSPPGRWQNRSGYRSSTPGRRHQARLLLTCLSTGNKRPRYHPWSKAQETVGQVIVSRHGTRSWDRLIYCAPAWSPGALCQAVCRSSPMAPEDRCTAMCARNEKPSKR